MSVIICRPQAWTFRRVLFCPTCERRRRFVVETFIWYDSEATCLGCGDSWSGGWRNPRPFVRGWRKAAIAAARAKWATAPPRAEVEASLRAEVAAHDI